LEIEEIMDEKRRKMRKERMNLYKACQQYIDQKVDLKRIQNKKDEAVDLEYFEEAAVLYEREKELSEELISMCSDLEKAIADPEGIGVSLLTLFPFRRSLFEESNTTANRDRDRQYLQMIAWESGGRCNSDRLCLLEYFAIENWTEFFMERKECLEKCLQEGNRSYVDRMAMEKELRQIKRDLFNTPKHQ